MVFSDRKVKLPLLPTTILCREALLQLLEDALITPRQHQAVAHKLVLVRAPAGYGKTTLLADFARRTDVPFGWYFLNREEADLCIFLKTFTSLFFQTHPEMEQAFPLSLLQQLAAAMQAEEIQQRKQAWYSYTSLLEQHLTRPFILCLCNYHELQEGEALRGFLNHLLLHMPPHLSLVIESRAVPSLELAPLLARRELLGLGSDMLRFSAQEIREFSHLQRGIPIAEGDAEQLVKTFDGWIAGILLSTHLGQAYAAYPSGLGEVSWNSPAFFADQHILFAYIKHEVFANEAQAFTFLQETSLLPTLNAPQCNHLLQIENAEEILTHLERQGLFVSRGRSQEVSSPLFYVLHPALRRLLYEDFHRTHPERVRSLHSRTAAFLYMQQDYEQALAHAENAQDYALGVDILLRATSSERQQVSQEVIARWIDRLPASIREHYPQLLLIRATIHLALQEYHLAAPLLEQAKQLFTENPSSGGNRHSASALLGEITIAQGRILFQEGKYMQAHQLCLQALNYLSADEIKPRIAALTCLGICKTLLNEYADGIATLQQALQLSGPATINQQTAYIYSCLANNYSLTCNYALEEHYRTRAIATYEHLGDMQGKINNLIWMAILKRNKGAFHEAEALLQDVLNMARQAKFRRGESYILFNLGAYYVDVAAFPQALAALEDCLPVARSIGDIRLTNQCLCELTLVYLLMGDHSTAQFLLTQVSIPQAEKASYEALFYELIQGTVLLYQNEVERAFLCLQALEPQAQKMGLKRMYIECLIRLTICQYKLQRHVEMEASMAKVVQVVTQGYFVHVPLIELRRFPDVWQVVQTFANHACIDDWRTLPAQVREKEQDGLSARERLERVSPITSGARLSIQAFGESVISINGSPVTHWHMARSMEMCYFLLEYQKPIRKELLIEALWPTDEEYVDQTFRSALHYLRKIIGKECVTSQKGLYSLNLDVLYENEIWYDVEQFQYHYLKAKEALVNADTENARASFQSMIELYRGDYLQAFYSNWCTGRREELRQRYIEARRELARMAWEDDHLEESMAHWQQMLAVDSCSEEAHYGLMRCYVRFGKRSLAVRQYQRYAKTIEHELALSPAPLLQKFYQRLIQGS